MRRFGIILAVITLTARAQVKWVQNGPSPSTGGQVENIADGEVAGAVNAVAAHPTDANVLYIGTVNGGIWRTTNATDRVPTWTELLGLDQSLSIGALAFDPGDGTNQTLVAGSGRFSSFRRGGDRVGVWRTTDGGMNWKLLDGGGTLAGINISGIAARGAILLVSANDADAPDRVGIWRSIDTGQNWTLVSGLPGTGLPEGSAFDLAADPAASTRFYTNAGSNGIFETENSGATWTKVSNSVIAALLPSAVNVKIAVGMANNVYVAVAGATGRLIALLRSPNGGSSWNGLDLPITIEDGARVGIHPGKQADTNLSLAADRMNPNVVYIGGDRQPALHEFTSGAEPLFPNSIGANAYSGRLFRIDASKTSGKQAVAITHMNTLTQTAPHADSRAMQLTTDGNMIEVDDGGVYRRTSPLTNTGDWFSVNGNLNIAEFHSIAWDPNAHVVIAGAQDTGTPEQIQTAGARWRSVDTADGAAVTVGASITPGQSVRYSSCQFLGTFRRRIVDQSNSVIDEYFPAFTPMGDADPLEPQFITPIVVNNTNARRVVIGANNGVYESIDGGDTVMEIGTGITVNFIDSHPLAVGATDNADMLYVGSGDQVITRSVLGSALEASEAYPGSGTGRIVAGIAIDRKHSKTAFVVDESRVYATADAGHSWTDITGNLPALLPGRLYAITLSTSNAGHCILVGSAAGVFASRGPAFGKWERFGSGLPRALVYDLTYDPSDEVLVAGLLGRGAWIASMKEPAPPQDHQP